MTRIVLAGRLLPRFSKEHEYPRPAASPPRPNGPFACAILDTPAFNRAGFTVNLGLTSPLRSNSLPRRAMFFGVLPLIAFLPRLEAK